MGQIHLYTALHMCYLPISGGSSVNKPSYSLLAISHCMSVKWQELKSVNIRTSLFAYSIHILVYYLPNNLYCVFNNAIVMSVHFLHFTCTCTYVNGIPIFYLSVGNIRSCVSLYLQLHEYPSKQLTTRGIFITQRVVHV